MQKQITKLKIINWISWIIFILNLLNFLFFSILLLTFLIELFTNVKIHVNENWEWTLVEIKNNKNYILEKVMYLIIYSSLIWLLIVLFNLILKVSSYKFINKIIKHFNVNTPFKEKNKSTFIFFLLGLPISGIIYRCQISRLLRFSIWKLKQES